MSIGFEKDFQIHYRIIQYEITIFGGTGSL
jgi:hypothetical protein